MGLNAVARRPRQHIADIVKNDHKAETLTLMRGDNLKIVMRD